MELTRIVHKTLGVHARVDSASAAKLLKGEWQKPTGRPPSKSDK